MDDPSELPAARPDEPSRPVKDGMHPPTIPQLVHCIHCGEEYDSWRIEWRLNDRGRGFWCCPIPGCGGAGFGMDIYPTDYDSSGRWTDPDGREIFHMEDDEEFDDDLDALDELPGTVSDEEFGEDQIPF